MKWSNSVLPAAALGFLALGLTVNTVGAGRERAITGNVSAKSAACPASRQFMYTGLVSVPPL